MKLKFCGRNDVAYKVDNFASNSVQARKQE